MASFLTVIGGITWVAALIALILGGVSLVLHFAEVITARIEIRAYKDERERIARDLITDSRWFSESKETQSAIRIIGDRLLHDAATCVSSTRDAWRKENGTTEAKPECQSQPA